MESFGALNPKRALCRIRLSAGFGFQRVSGQPNASGGLWFKFASRARNENQARSRHRQLAKRATRDDIPQGGFRNFSQPHRAFQLAHTMTDEDERELESELARLQQEHRDLDAAIDALHQSPAPDLLRLQRLKKRKLQLRDRIAFIEDQITPDIIA
jgi:hypothetical protein